MKLFTAANELSNKTAVSVDTHLVVIVGFEHRHLEYFIQGVVGNVFDQVLVLMLLMYDGSMILQ